MALSASKSQNLLLILIVTVIISLSYFSSPVITWDPLNCLSNPDFQAKLQGNYPRCWPLDSNVECQWCSDECNDHTPCPNGKVCCIKECGSACVPANSVGASVDATQCPVKQARRGCQPMQSSGKCSECGDYCTQDKQCSNDGMICCPTRCGNRCLEPIL